MTAALAVASLRKQYGTQVEALKSIDLTVPVGDFFALLGPNGAGKSTLIGIVTSLITKTAGSVRVFDYDLDTHPEMVKTHIGVVPQEFNFNTFEKVEDILVQQAGYYGIHAKKARERSLHYLRQLGLLDKRYSIAYNLSGGMKRRLMIARALVHNPQLLILDEPTAGVDIEVRRSMWDFLLAINAQGTTIILTTHYLEEAEQLCRNIAIINKGEVIEHGSMQRLLQKMRDQSFVLELAEPVSQVPQSSLANFALVDKQTIIATINEKASVNDIFKVLANNNIAVASMRTKNNRLEELFLALTK